MRSFTRTVGYYNSKCDIKEVTVKDIHMNQNDSLIEKLALAVLFLLLLIVVSAIEYLITRNIRLRIVPAIIGFSLGVRSSKTHK
ncbi:hypothetical protein C5Q98_06260 [Fastidiosipila sanguinis]|uniref:Uncharacterized protein n=1 Tax=Fastidiosipila sanguinis TaxID=236753 RepID=A0A2S0KP98_9FIRM|nr:hypothetical protein C5Q98_06260 [Fastidiosipila sanguinis]